MAQGRVGQGVWRGLVDWSHVEQVELMRVRLI